jgi:hypothetical protein
MEHFGLGVKVYAEDSATEHWQINVLQYKKYLLQPIGAKFLLG